MRGTWKAAALFVGSIVSMTTVADAQPLGAFSWQQQPYCNRIVVNVTQTGDVFTLDGYDDQCGAARGASVVGIAFQNPNFTIGLAMTIVTTPGAAPVHVDAQINLATLNGQWTDNSTASGTFVFNGPGGGPSRPLGAKSGPLEINATLNALPEIRLNGGDSIPDIVGYRVAGSLSSPLATSINSTLLNVGGGGFGGTNFTGATGQIFAYSREQFTDTAHGTALFFATTPNGSSGPTTRMMIEHDGQVGIGAFGPGTPPLEMLHVKGDIRVGTSGTNGCVQNNNGGTIAGTACASDLRFKRDITSYSSMLDRVTSLRPVQFYWRAAEFADRGFGDAREDGLIAQEVEQVLPELVSTDAEGFKAVNYTTLPLLTLQAVKELKAENDRLKEQNAALERRLATLETAILRR
jgi:hypothetical protein